VAHVGFGDPVCATVAAVFKNACGCYRRGGQERRTYVCMEGPQFSTRAESNLYRSWGADVIGMTNLQEAKLAREAEICYATMAMVTDYDCWRKAMTMSPSIRLLRCCIRTRRMRPRFYAPPSPPCRVKRAAAAATPLKYAILTDRKAIPAETRKRLAILLDKYLQ